MLDVVTCAAGAAGDMRVRSLRLVLSFEKNTRASRSFLKTMAKMRPRLFAPLVQPDTVETFHVTISESWDRRDLDARGDDAGAELRSGLARRMMVRIEEAIIDGVIVPRALAEASVINIDQYTFNKVTHNTFGCIIAGWPVWRDDRGRAAFVPEWWGGFMSDVLENEIVGCDVPHVNIYDACLTSEWEDDVLHLVVAVDVAAVMPSTFTRIINYAAYNTRVVGV